MQGGARGVVKLVIPTVGPDTIFDNPLLFQQKYLIDNFLRLDDASKMLWLLELNSPVWKDSATTFCDSVKTNSSTFERLISNRNKISGARSRLHKRERFRDFLEITRRIKDECPGSCACHLAESTTLNLDQVISKSI